MTWVWRSWDSTMCYTSQKTLGFDYFAQINQKALDVNG